MLIKRICSTCHEEKPISEYGKNSRSRGGYYARCRSCQNKYRRKKWVEDEEYRRKKQDEYLLREYGISLLEYESVAELQDFKCAICQVPAEESYGGRLRVDHDHETGKVRGLLCHRCNVGIGHFADNIEILLSAISYLKEHN